MGELPEGTNLGRLVIADGTRTSYNYFGVDVLTANRESESVYAMLRTLSGDDQRGVGALMTTLDDERLAVDERAKLMLIAIKNLDDRVERLKYDLENDIVRESVVRANAIARGEKVEPAGAGNKRSVPVEEQSFYPHINQSRSSFCVPTCASMVIAKDAGIEPTYDMQPYLGGIYRRDVGAGTGRKALSWPHHMFELLGYESARYDYARVNPADLRSEHAVVRMGANERIEYAKQAVKKLTEKIQEGNRAVLLVERQGGLHAILIVGCTSNGQLLVHDPSVMKPVEMRPDDIASSWFMKGLEGEYNKGEYELYATIIPEVSGNRPLAANRKWVDMSAQSGRRDPAKVDGLPYLLKLRTGMGLPVGLKIDEEIVKVVGYKGELTDPNSELVVEYQGGKREEMTWSELAKLTEDRRSGSVLFGF